MFNDLSGSGRTPLNIDVGILGMPFDKFPARRHVVAQNLL